MAKRPAKKTRAAAVDDRLRARVEDLERQVMVAERLRFESVRTRGSPAPASFDARTFVAGVAHEFNNILGAADGHAEWALESGKVSEMREALEIVRLACSRSAQITRGLQGLFQPREENKAIFGLRRALAELTQIFRVRAEKEGVSFDIRVPDARLYGDPVRLLEVFVNLVKNAFEAFASMPKKSKSASPTVTIIGRLRSSKEGRVLELRFKDNGPGIPDVYRDLIFQPFFTTKGAFAGAVADASSSTAPAENAGSGLGLFLSRQIIEEHGGTLACPRNSKGTMFEIHLPLGT